jgi:hypothetical protein
MNIGGGITFLTHILIIIVHWIIKKPIHFVIILVVFIFYFSQFLLLSKVSFNDNNLENIYDYFTGNKYVVDDILSANSDISCSNKDIIDPSKKYVILMLDDLQTAYLRPLSLKIINEAISRKIPVTLGITPLSVKYDSQLTSFLKQNKCNLELAQY